MSDERGEQSGDGASGAYRVGTRTDVGLRREHNEDYLVVRRTEHGLLLIVCDGMGGHAGGERASRIAAETCAEFILASDGTPEELLAAAVSAANRAVVDEAERDPTYYGMGTTLVGALVVDGHAVVANVGDSRAYTMHGGALARVTTDHSLVAEMVARGEITEEQAAHHPRRNVVTRALGTNEDVAADIIHVPLGAGDTLLLTSDGLHGMIGDAAIAAILRADDDPAAICDRLVAQALAAGGDDNVTVVVARSAAGAPEAETPTQQEEAAAPSRRPRGLGLIIGVGLGAVGLMAALMFFWRIIVIDVNQRGVERRDTSSEWIPDSIGTVPADTSRGGGASPGAPPADSLLHPGDTIRL